MESPGFARYWSESERMIPGKGDLHDYWRDISTAGDFLGPPSSYILIRDSVLRLCHRMITHSIAGRSQAPEKVTVTDLFYLRGMDVGSINVPYLLARYLRLFVAGRKSEAHISGGHFVARLARNFGLLTAKILGGLIVIALELPIIDMGPERQPDAAAGTPAIVEDAPAIDEGNQAISAPVQVPQQPPSPPPTAARTMPQRLGRLEEEHSKDALDRGLARPAPLQLSRTHNSQTHDPSYPYLFKQDITLNARMGKRDDFKCVEAEDKSNLKTLL
ncbi:hypothetical protein Tco_0564328 [Tanacetum coccineum]